MALAAVNLGTMYYTPLLFGEKKARIENLAILSPKGELFRQKINKEPTHFRCFVSVPENTVIYVTENTIICRNM
jgi:hypothetical protein